MCSDLFDRAAKIMRNSSCCRLAEEDSMAAKQKSIYFCLNSVEIAI
jgi:hypothetical protein